MFICRTVWSVSSFFLFSFPFYLSFEFSGEREVPREDALVALSSRNLLCAEGYKSEELSLGKGSKKRKFHVFCQQELNTPPPIW